MRALCFYSYPKDRSEFSIRAHRLTKIESEFETIHSKVSGTDVAYKNNDVFCYVAVADMLVDDEDNEDGYVPEDPALVIPGTNQIVCGTIELNVGVNLPAEELVGALPIENARTKRCYLSNVCVLKAYRNLGIAKHLIERAIDDARTKRRVEEVYVHVVSDNVAAKRLYEKSGIVKESRETAKEVLQRRHPAREILRYIRPSKKS